jgi:hypothetical protein
MCKNLPLLYIFLPRVGPNYLKLLPLFCREILPGAPHAREAPRSFLPRPPPPQITVRGRHRRPRPSLPRPSYRPARCRCHRRINWPPPASSSRPLNNNNPLSRLWTPRRKPKTICVGRLRQTSLTIVIGQPLALACPWPGRPQRNSSGSFWAGNFNKNVLLIKIQWFN